MNKKTSSVKTCSKDEAKIRLKYAQKFLEIAELTIDDTDDASIGVATANAVLSGIAASDAICCTALGSHSRGNDHKEAVSHLKKVQGAEQAAKNLAKLLSIKTESHYGLNLISKTKGETAIKNAQRLIEFAKNIV